MKTPNGFIYNEATEECTITEFRVSYTISTAGAIEFDRWRDEMRSKGKHVYFKDFYEDLINKDVVKVFDHADSEIQEINLGDELQKSHRKANMNKLIPSVGKVIDQQGKSFFRVVEDGFVYDSELDPTASIQAFYITYAHQPDWKGDTATISQWYNDTPKYQRDSMGLTREKLKV